MDFQPTFVQCQLLLFGGVVALVALLGVSFTPDLGTASFSPGVCEGCHNSFAPLEMEVEVERVESDWPAYTINVEVRNPDEHEVQELRLVINDDNITTSGTGGESDSGSVASGSTTSHILDLEPNVKLLDIYLDGDEGFFNSNDIDLEVWGPSGGNWVSDGSTADEEIHIQADALAEEGPGEYDIEISWIAGEGNVDYELTIEYLLETDPLEREGRRLHEGRSQGFSWYLNLTDEQAENLTLTTSLMAFYDHDGKGPDLEHYTLIYRQGEVVKHDAKDFGDLGLGQALGMAMLFLVVVSSVTGFYAASRLPVPEWFARAPRKLRYRGHTRASLLLLILAIPHALVLQRGIYAGTPEWLISGLPTLLSLVVMTIITLDMKRLARRWGWKQWQWVHRGTIVVFLLLLAFHILRIATHL